jgi:glycerol-3-phosphate O-acyltransferase
LSVDEPKRAQLELLANLADAVLQRYSMVLQLIGNSEPMERDTLEQQAHQLALRLSTLHGLDSPEFHDKRLFVTLINALKDQGYLYADADHKLQKSDTFSGLDAMIRQLLPATVEASICQIGRQTT